MAYYSKLFFKNYIISTIRFQTIFHRRWKGRGKEKNLKLRFDWRKQNREIKKCQWEESEGHFYASEISWTTSEKNNKDTLSVVKLLPLPPLPISTITIHLLTSSHSSRFVLCTFHLLPLKLRWNDIPFRRFRNITITWIRLSPAPTTLGLLLLWRYCAIHLNP